VDFGPLPEIHAAIPNTLPGLLGKPIKWVSTAPLVGPQNDETHFLFSIKAPTVAFIDGKWEIYATANMVMGAAAAPLVQPGAARPARGGTFNMEPGSLPYRGGGGRTRSTCQGSSPTPPRSIAAAGVRSSRPSTT
jgi:hypothetical protein